MAKIPQHVIDELLQRVDIVDVIQSYVPLVKKGQNYQACCPFHQEKTPSFTVHPGKQFFHCFGCQANGNAISFLMDHDQLDFRAAIDQLAEKVGYVLPQTHDTPVTQARKSVLAAHHDAAQFYQQALRQHPEAIDYLKQRGLTGVTAQKFALGFAPAGWDHLFKAIGHRYPDLDWSQTGLFNQKERGPYDRFRHRIMFPIRDVKGQVIAFGGRVLQNDEQPKYLNSPETAIFQKSHELYGLFEARTTHRQLDRLIITEGYMDVLALAQHGLTQTVATLGTAITEKHIIKLIKYSQRLLFCFDGDTAGQQAAHKALQQCLPHYHDDVEVRFFTIPTGHDPDSLIREIGAEAFEQQLQQAPHLGEVLLQHHQSQQISMDFQGKAQFAQHMSQAMAQMPDNHKRHLLLSKVQQLTGMDLPQLQRPLRTDYPKRSAQSTASQTTPPPRSVVRRALALLIQQPQLAQAVASIDDSISNDLPGIKLLRELHQQLQHMQETPHTGALLESWRDTTEFNTICTLAHWDHGIPDELLEEELTACLAKLKQQTIALQIDTLMLKARGTGLDTNEQIALQDLLRRKQQPQPHRHLD